MSTTGVASPGLPATASTSAATRINPNMNPVLSLLYKMYTNAQIGVRGLNENFGSRAKLTTVAAFIGAIGWGGTRLARGGSKNKVSANKH